MKSTISQGHLCSTELQPVDSRVVAHLNDTGLEGELQNVILNAHNVVTQLNNHKTFLSSSDALHVLRGMKHHLDDMVFVVSRSDRHGFWTQKDAVDYINLLTDRAAANGGHLNQTRVWVYNDNYDDLLPEDSILLKLEDLHASKTLFNYPSSLFGKYRYLSQLIFGVTVSTKHGYAIIPTPAQSINSDQLDPEQIVETLKRHQHYDHANGPMKAIVTFNVQFVQTLIDEFKTLLSDGSAARLK